VSIGSKAVYGYDPLTGKEIWKVIERGAHSASTRPVTGFGFVYIPTGFDGAQLLAVRPDGSGDVTATHVAWRFAKGVPQKPSILLIDDLIVMVNDSGVVTAIEAKTGEFVWRGRVDGTYSASPLAAGGRIYTFSEDGKTTVLEAGRAFKVLSENFLEDGFMASPAADGNALFLRTRTHLYRIEESR
jgi:outer membrane protein assembly factor BamB